MKKISKKADWKKTMAESSEKINQSLDELLAFLQKNKKSINKEIKEYGTKGSGVSELFDILILNVDKKIHEILDIIED